MKVHISWGNKRRAQGMKWCSAVRSTPWQWRGARKAVGQLQCGARGTLRWALPLGFALPFALALAWRSPRQQLQLKVLSADEISLGTNRHRPLVACAQPGFGHLLGRHPQRELARQQLR